MSFSGGSYDEIERWLRNFLVSHAKRVDPRIEIALEAGDAREGVSFGARLRLADRTTALMELDFEEVAAQRGSLAWCAALAARVQQVARAELIAAAPARR
jgi:hypothetical protein